MRSTDLESPSSPPVFQPLPLWGLRLTLLLISSMTVMAGATVAPSMPQMSRVFAQTPNAEFLARLVLTLPALCIALAGPAIGWVIDRWGRLPMLYVSLTGYALAGTSGLYLDSLEAILVGRALLGLSVGGLMTTANALIADCFEPRARSRFLGTQYTFMALGGVVFVGLGGVLADVHWRAPFWMYFGSLLILPLVWRFLYEPSRRRASPDVPRDLLSVDQPPGYSPWAVGFIYALAFVTMVCFFMIPVQIPFLLEELGSRKNALSGLAIILMALSAAGTGSVYSRLKARFSHPMLYALGFSIGGLAFALLSQINIIAGVMMVMVLVGISNGISNPNGSVWLLSIIPEHLRGRLIGGYSTAVFLGQFFSPILLQPFVAATSLQASFGLVGLVLLGLSVAFAVGSWVGLRRRASWANP